MLRIIYIASLVLHNLNQGVIPTQGYRKHPFASIYHKCTEYTWFTVKSNIIKICNYFQRDTGSNLVISYLL